MVIPLFILLYIISAVYIIFLKELARKISIGLNEIKFGKRKKIFLGNLNSKRDWGYAGDYVETMWQMLQQKTPEDFVVGTGETHSVREFCEKDR